MGETDRVALDESCESFKALHEDWVRRAKAQTVDTLPAFIAEVMNGYVHDYGTTCHAIAVCAVAAAYACNRTPGARGGITGFQAEAVMWGFIQAWRGLEWARKQAAARLQRADDDAVSPSVIEHWRLLAAGGVPFGMWVSHD